MAIEKIFTSAAPAPIGPYSQGVIVNGMFVYTAGQIPIDPQTNDLVDGDIKAQTRQVIQNLEKVLLEGRSSLRSVVRGTDRANCATCTVSSPPAIGWAWSRASPARSSTSTVRVSRPAGSR